MQKFAIIEICKVTDLKKGDELIYSKLIVKINKIRDENFLICEYYNQSHLTYIAIPKNYNAYYKVHKHGNGLKIDDWKKLIRNKVHDNEKPKSL